MLITPINLLYSDKSKSIFAKQKTNPVKFLSKSLLFCDVQNLIVENKIDDIKKLSDYNIVNKNQETLLHASALNGNVEISKFLLSNGLNPNLCDKRGKTPFLNACTSGNEKLVETFLLYNANPNIQDNIGNTALHRSVFSPKLTELLLKHGANPYIKNEFEKTPFESSYLYPKSLEIFLRHEINPNLTNSENKTLMHKAIAENNLEVAKILKKYNADINFKDSTGKSPIFYSNNCDGLRWLVENGAKINLYDNKNLPPLAYAKNLKIMEKLLNYGATPDVITPGGASILHNVVKKNNLKAVYLLTINKANPNIQDKDGNIPLDYASNADIKTLLLAAGTNPNHKNYLISALKKHDFEHFNNLLECGANPNKTDNRGKTSIFFIDNIDELNQLKKYGADFNSYNNDGYSPIHHFALLGNNTMVNILIENGADANLLSKHGETLDKCYEKFNKYNSWIKKDKNNNKISFTGLSDYDFYGTPSLRLKLNYKTQLTTNKIDETIVNAKTIDEGIIYSYKALKDEENKIYDAINSLPIVLSHYNHNLKENLIEMAHMNPSGSKIPILGILKQLNDTVFSDNFIKKLEGKLKKSSMLYDDIINNYYNKNIINLINNYNLLNTYLNEGIRYVNYLEGPSKTRLKVLENLEISLNRCENKNTKCQNMINNLGNKYQTAFNNALEHQYSKQNKRTTKKIVIKIVTLGSL